MDVGVEWIMLTLLQSGMRVESDFWQQYGSQSIIIIIVVF